MKIKPTQDRVLIEIAASPTRTPSGLHLPEQSQGKPSNGIVRAVGPGRRTRKGLLIPVDLVPGDKVSFMPYRGQDIEIDGVPCRLIEAKDVLGIVGPPILKL